MEQESTSNPKGWSFRVLKKKKIILFSKLKLKLLLKLVILIKKIWLKINVLFFWFF
jgi:hypothetical protein